MLGRADDRVIGATRMSSELKPYKKTVYPDYESLVLDWPAERVLRITISRGKVNAMNYQLHHDISQIWRLIDRDQDVNAVIVPGAGDYFSAGGDFATDRRIPPDYNLILELSQDTREIVENMICCYSPLTSAITAPATAGALSVSCTLHTPMSA